MSCICLQSAQTNAGPVTQIRPRPFPSTSLPIQHSLIILPFDVIPSEILIVTLTNCTSESNSSSLYFSSQQELCPVSPRGSQNQIGVVVPAYTYRHHADWPLVTLPILKTVAACPSETFGFHPQNHTGCYYNRGAALCHVQAARHTMCHFASSRTHTVPVCKQQDTHCASLQAAGHTLCQFASSRTHTVPVCKQQDTHCASLQAAGHPLCKFASSRTHTVPVCKQQNTHCASLHAHCVYRPVNIQYLKKEKSPMDGAMTALHTSSTLSNVIFSSNTPGLCQPAQSNSR